MIEILLALWSNVRGAAFPLALAAGLVTAGAAIFALIAEIEDAEEVSARAAGGAKKCVVAFAILAFLACLPTVDDLWKVRIGLIKYRLAAPENVQQATEAIERLGKKLECKYLGGCEEKEPKP